MPLTIGTNPDAFGIWTLDDRRRFPWPQWLDAVAAAGYHQVELGSLGYAPVDGAAVRDDLARRGLTLTAGYLGRLTPDPARRETIDTQLREVGRVVADAGGPFLVAIAGFYRDSDNRPNGASRLDDEGWASFTRVLNDVAMVAGNEFGLRIAFHAHMDTVIEAPEDVDRLLEQTDDGVGLCLDVGQLGYRGADPVAVLRRWAGRVNYVHLRDLDPVVTEEARRVDLPFELAVRRGVFCDPGQGLLDLPAFTAAVHEVGFDGPLIVERSLIGSTAEEAGAAAVRAREYYESIGLVPASQEG